MGAARCAMAAVLFGATTPAVSRLTDDLSAFTLAGLLYLGAAVAVLPWVLHDPPARQDVRASRLRLAIAVASGGLLGPVLVVAALGRAPASTVSLALNLEVVFTVVIAGLVFREKLGRRVLVGGGAVAVAAATLGWTDEVELRVGVVFVVLACVAWAVDNAVTAHLDTLMPHHITMAKGAVAGSVNLALGLVMGGAVHAGAVAAALVIGAIGYGASITLWIGGAQRIGAARGQVIFAVAPFVGVATAWLVLREPIDPRSALALVFAIGGVALVVSAPRRRVG